MEAPTALIVTSQDEVVDYNVHEVYPSDHKPVYVEFEILN